MKNYDNSKKKKKKTKAVEDFNDNLGEIVRTLMKKSRSGLVYVRELNYCGH